MEFALDLMQTTALAMIFFLLGRVIVAHVEFLRRVCIPAPVVGGLVFAQLNVIPEDGSHPEVDVCGLHIRVEELSDRRVEWATVSRLEPAHQDEEAAE